jgi:shikimate kinase
MKIYLIGMPGSGKTTLGQVLATKLSLPFVDLDQEIEQSERASIAEIFSAKGEDYFRKIESAHLSALSSGSADFVLSTGGGAPCFYQGIDVMNNSGITIFLNVPTEVLLQRLKRKTDRPLLQTESEKELRDRIGTLVEKRMDTYKKASIVVDDPTTDKVLQSLTFKR